MSKRPAGEPENGAGGKRIHFADESIHGPHPFHGHYGDAVNYFASSGTAEILLCEYKGAFTSGETPGGDGEGAESLKKGDCRERCFVRAVQREGAGAKRIHFADESIHGPEHLRLVRRLEEMERANRALKREIGEKDALLEQYQQADKAIQAPPQIPEPSPEAAQSPHEPSQSPPQSPPEPPQSPPEPSQRRVVRVRLLF
ncbi:hypothetical protein HNY73_008102 [Argiope bruennichi]|uniref:Uncharacterized protein n=1 Tax=Argiope bruennichi TaxID=94029 RepID=A0A8T0F693_ARGBR|nr:hypothetical protein HNY73_008102 [Argiope bruennichi]